MNPSPTYNYPWELIVNSFTGGLSPDEEVQLQLWMSSDQGNSQKYSQLREIWENGLEDYRYYRMADENSAWNRLRSKLQLPQEQKNINLSEDNKKRRFIYRIVAMAASVIILAGIGVWYTVIRHNAPVYETAYNEHKKINLADGSSILLEPQTKIEVSKNYNATNRTVELIFGKASFSILHQEHKHFIVDMERADVEDIGTGFTITRSNDQINVAVMSGKVVFVKKATGERHELAAGMGLTFHITDGRFSVAASDYSALQKQLEFNNTPLTDVVVIMQKVHGTKIEIVDKGIGQKKLTANLNGVPYLTAIKVICKSLSLDYAVKDSVCFLQGKAKMR